MNSFNFGVANYRSIKEADKGLVDIGFLSNYEWHLLHGKGEAGYLSAKAKLDAKVATLDATVARWQASQAKIAEKLEKQAALKVTEYSSRKVKPGKRINIARA